MKDWRIKTAIASMTLTLIPMGVQALDVEPAQNNAPPLPTNQIDHPVAGLRIDRSNIVSAFHGHLTEYFGDCPGEEWTGSAAKDNVRFIAYNQAPAKYLRVELVNLTSGEKLKKKYTKEGRGSFDFKVLRLGEIDGPQDIQYTIYNKKSDEVLNTGHFRYNLTTSSSSRYRSGEWRWEQFCASDSSDSIKNCKVVGKREKLYCQGSSTGHIRQEYIPHRRHNQKHHNHRSHKSKQYYPSKPTWW